MDRHVYFLSSKDCPVFNCGDDISFNNKQFATNADPIDRTKIKAIIRIANQPSLI